MNLIAIITLLQLALTFLSNSQGTAFQPQAIVFANQAVTLAQSAIAGQLASSVALTATTTSVGIPTPTTVIPNTPFATPVASSSLSSADQQALDNLLAQQVDARQTTLANLKAQIDRWQSQYNDNCAGGSESGCMGRKAEAVRNLNPLVSQYNALLGNASGTIYSVPSQTYFRYVADPSGYGGRLYDESGSASYTFSCDQFGSCSIY